MLRLSPSLPSDRPWRVLCLGAHGDDIEIGCGGTILRLLAEHPGAQVCWCVLTSNPRRESECQQAASLFLQRAGSAEVVIEKFRDGFLPWEGAAVKEFFESLKRRFSPDVIFTHYRHDLHQDHRQIAELTWNTFRDHWILEYEIPKYDGDFGAPGFFVPLTPDVCERKIDALLTAFPSQGDRRWFSEETFQAVMRLRGIECGSPTGYAEAFYCRKCLI
jgi:LmbE family N-acetylglucosaminyl deacetylase